MLVNEKKSIFNYFPDRIIVGPRHQGENVLYLNDGSHDKIDTFSQQIGDFVFVGGFEQQLDSIMIILFKTEFAR